MSLEKVAREDYQDDKYFRGIISSQDFGGKKQVTNNPGESSSTTPRNKIRLRASFTQTRSIGQTSTAVTRRRPFGTTAQSSTPTTETTPTQEKLEPTPKVTPKNRRLFPKPRARTGHSLDLEVTSDSSSTSSSTTKPTRLFGPTKSARPISSTKSAKSFSSTKSGKSINPTKTASLASSTKSEKSAGPTKSIAKSAKSISPSKPVNLVSSSRPAKPLGPLRFPRPNGPGALKPGSSSSPTSLPDSTNTASIESDTSTEIFEDTASTLTTTESDVSVGFTKLDALAKLKGRKVVTDTRKRLLQPSSIESTTNRERSTRKKFIGIKPAVKPTSTLAIITSGFYSSSSVVDTYDDYDSDLSKVQTPDLYSKTSVGNNYFSPTSIHDSRQETEKVLANTEQTRHHSGLPQRETIDDYDIVESKIRTPDLYSRTDIDNYRYSGRPITIEPEKTILKPEKTRYYDPSYRETTDDYDSDESNTETPDYRPKTEIDSYYSLIPFLFGAQKIFSYPDRRRYHNSPPLREKLDDYDNYEYSKAQTSNLRASTVLSSFHSPSLAPPEPEKRFSSPNKSSFSSPIIITDNFFYPLDGGEVTNSKNKYYTDNDSDIEEDDDSINVTTSSFYETENIASSPDDEKSLFKNKMTSDFHPIEKIVPMNDYQSVARIKTELRNLSLSLIDRELHKIKVNERLLLDVLLSSSLASRRQRKMKATLEKIDNHLKSTPTMTEFNVNTATAATTREFTGRNKKPARDQNLPELEPTQTKSASIEPSRVTKVNPITSENIQPITSPLPITPEDIEASLTDDLYLSLANPDFPQIESSQVESNNKNNLLISTSSQATPVIETSIYFSETVVTSTRLRTYTYVVTKLKGQDTEVSSSTTVRPRITTLTLTIPVTLTVTPTLASSPVALNTLVHSKNGEEAEDSGRRFNLATRVMSNGVEVIVAGTTPAYRWENSNPQPTLTLSEAVLMMLPQDKPNEFVTKTCTTTFTYLNTITRNGTTMVSTDQQVIANTATEERHRKPVTETSSVTLEASPTLQTEIFKTTYTYLTLNSDHPDEKNALESSTRVIVNTVTAPQYYLDMILEPSEVPRPETNTYYSTRMLEKTYVEEGKTKVEMTNDVVTQLIITESAPPSRSGSVASSITSDNVYDKAAVKKTNTKLHSVGATPEPIQIFATKTYLTTYTYFTTLLQAGSKGETSTTVSSRTQIVENVITESIAPSLLDAGYMNALLTTSHNSDSLKNVVTGSTIIFFDDEEQITPTSTFESASTSSNSFENASSAPIEDAVVAESNDVISRPVEPDNIHNEEEVEEESTNAPPNKKPSQVSNLLSLGSLGINSLSALGPVFSAMAGLLQGKNSATRRNDSEPVATESPTTTTQRSPIYIPVGDFADVDIETAESQNIALRVAGNNHLPETRHKVASSLVDGIPISPGEIIHANSDVIIGRPGKMGPRPPQTYAGSENIGMKPPPVPVPNIPVHPVLEVVDNDSSKKLITVNNEPLEIYPAHQIYEDHIKDHINFPPVRSHSAVSQKHTDLQQTFLHAPPPPPPKTISSKQDILENDPLLIPPSAYNGNLNNQQKSERKKHPWSPKDPITASNILVEDKHQVSYPQKDFIQTENTSGLKSKLKVPEPIIHQVPHVIDRSTGQPLLVNIQPSQVANVIIPQGGTQALIFGDTNEPHISGQYFDDPSPYPEPEVGPGFVGIDKVENLPQYSRKDNPSDYMTPPIQTTNLRPTDNNHNVGQGHVHTEILVHHGVESGFQRPQNKPSRNHQNVHFPPRREHVNVHIPVEQTPPRRTEVPISTDNLYYDPAGSSVNTNKKPHRNPPPRWPRPTARPRPPTRITGRPHGRPPTRIERPVSSNRPQPPLTQGLPNVHYQNEFNKHQYPTTESPVIFVNQNPHHSDQDNSHYEHYDVNSQNNRKNSVQSNQEEHVSNAEFGDKIITIGEGHNETNYVEKVSDSEVDASENIKITSEPQGGDNRGDFIIYDNVEPESSSKHEPTEYFSANISFHSDDSSNNKKPSYSINNQDKIIDDEIGDIIIGSEKKQDQYIVQPPPSGIITNQHSNGYKIQVSSDFEQKPVRLHDTIDLNPPAIIPKFEPNGHSRPFSNPHIIVASSGNKTKQNVETAEKNQNAVQGHILQGLGQVIHVQTEKKDSEKPLKTQKYEPNQVRGRPRPDYTTQVHPNHPQIITKLKPQVPGPVTIFSDKVHKHNSHRRPTQQFSLPIDSIGEENESKTQTERAPSSNNKVEESLDTAFQTNFASTDSKEEMENKLKNQTNVSYVEHQGTTKLKTIPLSQDMKPPPVSAVNTQKVIVKNPMADAGLKPPPPPTDVLGLSPPPVDITTTAKPASVENKPKKPSVSGLKPPPLYIPLKESKNTPSLPSTSMVPPNIRPSVVRPYLADILSEDMIPPPPEIKTTQTIELATARPGVEVSGSIQIATAVAASHIPVMQDSESKIPIVHGTVDLPVVIDVPEFLKPIDTKVPNHVSVYTVLPFETKQRNTIKPTISPSRVSSSTQVRQSQINRKQENSYHHQIYSSSRLPTSQVVKRPHKVSEISIILEPSTDVRLASTRIEPTKSLSNSDDYSRRTKHRHTQAGGVTKTIDLHYVRDPNDHGKSYPQNVASRKTDLKIKESASKMMEIIGTVVHEFIQNSTNEKVETKPQEVTRFETLTVTRTETSVLGSPPTTRTLLITHTLTSTSVETVTETLLRPTSVISTITSTVLHPVTRVPTYENEHENESIFVVMSDQKPPVGLEGAEEVEAEYGDEDVSRDEQDTSGNEIHRVLSGGIGGAPSVPIRPPKVHCLPECKAAKSEICAELRGEMHCVCRPGFSRMFPDRPCKPTYTYTVSVGLDRFGRDRFVYNPAMNDSNSVIFRRYAHPIKEALDRTLMQSDLRDVYRDINVVKFLSEPSRVLFNVQLSSNTEETRLADVIRKYLMMSNYSLGGTDVYAAKDLGMIEATDFDECATEENGPHHDCSPHAMCFNLKGTYQCSCKEGWADLSENSAYPGRHCSQAPLGCSACNNKGHCVVNSHGQEMCECFLWHTGKKCQINLKVLLIALVSTGVILLGLLAVCLGMACLRNPNRRGNSADRRAMISGMAGNDSSSETSVAELAIPHHVPHILPPPPQMLAPAPPIGCKPLKKMQMPPSHNKRRAPRKAPAPLIVPVPVSNHGNNTDQRDRSLTVMIPRAKYRSTGQTPTQLSCKPMSTFSVEEHKLIDYLEGNSHPVCNRKTSFVSNSDYKDPEPRYKQQQANFTTTASGALVSAGFQVSATVTTRGGLDPSVDSIKADLTEPELETRIQAATLGSSKQQMLRLDFAEAGSTLARSCGETTIQPPTKMSMSERKGDCRGDSASEGHTMAERDCGSTLRLPAQHAPLYAQDRTTSSDRESNFDSL